MEHDLIHPEPGDIVEMPTQWDGIIHAFVVRAWLRDPDPLLEVRWLKDGRIDHVLPGQCRVLIKRYHTLVGVPIVTLNDDLLDLNMRTDIP